MSIGNMKQTENGYIVYTNSNTGSELTIDLWKIFVEEKKSKISYS